MVQPLEAEVKVAEYLQECVDPERFLAYCRECGNYGKRWSCPPLDFDPLELWRRYATLHLTARVMITEKNMVLDDLMAGFQKEKQALLAELLKRERRTPGSRVLSAGTCLLCEHCRREQGEPCRALGQMRYSIEALGGDVAKTAEQYFHKSLQWIRDGQTPEYLVLVGGLLTVD